MVNLNFRVPPGYHINSNTPKSEVPDSDRFEMDLPTDIILGKIQYPAVRMRVSLSRRTKKLSVYSGDFTIAVAVHPLQSVVPGNIVMHGVLRYRPATMLPAIRRKLCRVSFEIKSREEPAAHKANRRTKSACA